jgi:hypothetical protein
LLALTVDFKAISINLRLCCSQQLTASNDAINYNVGSFIEIRRRLLDQFVRTQISDVSTVMYIQMASDSSRGFIIGSGKSVYSSEHPHQPLVNLPSLQPLDGRHTQLNISKHFNDINDKCCYAGMLLPIHYNQAPPLRQRTSNGCSAGFQQFLDGMN